MKNFLVKSDFLAAQQCLTMSWLRLRTNPTKISEADQFRMKQGQEIGLLARTLYPDGNLISETDPKSAVEITQDLVADLSIGTLFEAAFTSGPFTARADILSREDGGWHVLEAKSSFADTSNIRELVDDLSYTVMILRRAGLAVARASLLLLSRSYCFGDGPENLFEIIDQTKDVNSRVTEFDKTADGLAIALVDGQRPTPALMSACRNCEFFSEKCLGCGVAHTVLEIPGLHYTKLKRLSAANIIDLTQAPGDLQLNSRQQRVLNSALSGRMLVESGLGEALKSIVWPCHYLDFETVATVLPLYPGHGCHRQVLTQFSIHHRQSCDAELNHSEYLANASKDCERELAVALIDSLGDRGSIMVYSSFEATRIKALRDEFPDLAPELEAILSRLFDLLPIIEVHVYHPDFRGSFSIKKVLPVLVPDLSYDDLEVADGNAAITEFARMARGEILGDMIEITRQHLLEYCKRDTYAMVKLHDTLIRLQSGQYLR